MQSESQVKPQWDHAHVTQTFEGMADKTGITHLGSGIEKIEKQTKENIDQLLEDLVADKPSATPAGNAHLAPILPQPQHLDSNPAGNAPAPATNTLASALTPGEAVVFEDLQRATYELWHTAKASGATGIEQSQQLQPSYTPVYTPVAGYHGNGPSNKEGNCVFLGLSMKLIDSQRAAQIPYFTTTYPDYKTYYTDTNQLDLAITNNMLYTPHDWLWLNTLAGHESGTSPYIKLGKVKYEINYQQTDSANVPADRLNANPLTYTTSTIGQRGSSDPNNTSQITGGKSYLYKQQIALGLDRIKNFTALKFIQYVRLINNDELNKSLYHESHITDLEYKKLLQVLWGSLFCVNHWEIVVPGPIPLSTYSHVGPAERETIVRSLKGAISSKDPIMLAKLEKEQAALSMMSLLPCSSRDTLFKKDNEESRDIRTLIELIRCQNSALLSGERTKLQVKHIMAYLGLSEILLSLEKPCNKTRIPCSIKPFIKLLYLLCLAGEVALWSTKLDEEWVFMFLNCHIIMRVTLVLWASFGTPMTTLLMSELPIIRLSLMMPLLTLAFIAICSKTKYEITTEDNPSKKDIQSLYLSLCDVSPITIELEDRKTTEHTTTSSSLWSQNRRIAHTNKSDSNDMITVALLPSSSL